MGGGGVGRYRERRYADHIFIQIYFRIHLFVVKFSLFSSPRVCLDPPNQNPADALVIRVCGDSSSHTVLVC